MNGPTLRATLASLALFVSAAVLMIGVAPGCRRPIDEAAFRKRAETAYERVHLGWTIQRREPALTYFVRGDQVDTLDVAALFEAFKEKGQRPRAFFRDWQREEEAKARARRRSVAQAQDDLVPILKSGGWVRAQDLGAIGPARAHDAIRPWRREVAPEVFLVLGIPEERLGYRHPSIEEMRTAEETEDALVKRAIGNVARQVGDERGVEIRGNAERLLVLDLPNQVGVGGLLLDPAFRAELLARFGRDHLGAAVPLREVLIVFDPEETSALRPVRARAHQLYDTQNHASLRGLLRFDRERVGILEPADPKKTLGMP